MLKFKNSTIERLLGKLKKINVGNFNKKLVFGILDEIKFKTSANTIKLSVKLDNKDDYVEILNGNNRLYYGNNNVFFNDTFLTLNINPTYNIILKAPNITHFKCSNNKITELNLNKAKHLCWVECRDNLLTNLDLTKNDIYLIDCSNNKRLTNIGFNSNNTSTKSLSYHNTGISVLELNKLLNLENLDCSSCLNISDIDISNNKQLQSIFCYNCSLYTLNTDNNLKLGYINCSSNNIITINTDKNQKLSYLNCADNELESLDIKNNKNLQILDCSKNKLSGLDISGNTKLLTIECYRNLFDSSAIINLLNQLLKIESAKRKCLSINNNLHSDLSSPKELADALKKLKEKGWEIFYK